MPTSSTAAYTITGTALSRPLLTLFEKFSLVENGGLRVKKGD